MRVRVERLILQRHRAKSGEAITTHTHTHRAADICTCGSDPSLSVCYCHYGSCEVRECLAARVPTVK